MNDAAKRRCQVQEWKLSGEVQVQGRGPFLLDSRLRGYTWGQVVLGQAGEGLPTDCCFFFFFSIFLVRPCGRHAGS